MSDLLNILLEPWNYEFMVRGITVTLIAGVVCSLISCWLILIGWSLLGDALSHAVLPGVVVAYMIGIPFSIGAIVAALVVVGLIFAVRSTSQVKSDASMGVVFTTFFALGLVLVSKNPSNVDLNHVLFGDLLGITDADMMQVLVLAPATMLVLLIKRRDITAYAFDRVHLEAIGISSKSIGLLLLICLSFTVVSAMQAVGAILIIMLLITPGATAFLITDKFRRMFWIAPLLSVVTTFVAIYISYWCDAASGAMVVSVGGFIFFLVWMLSPRGLRGYVRARLLEKKEAEQKTV